MNNEQLKLELEKKDTMIKLLWERVNLLRDCFINHVETFDSHQEPIKIPRKYKYLIK